MVSGSVDLYAGEEAGDMNQSSATQGLPGQTLRMKVIDKFSGVDYMIIPAAMQNGLEGEMNGSRELLQRHH